MKTQLPMILICVLFLHTVSQAAPTARDVLQTTGITGGLIVQLGCDSDAQLEQLVALHATDSYLVQGLDTDAAAVTTARKFITKHNTLGPITAQLFDGRHLPYVDNLINLLIADDLGKCSMREVMRVLAPGGVAYVQGKATVKLRPDDIDQWTHYLHGPDNNAVANDTRIGPPRYTQWISNPVWTRNHHKVNSISSVVTAGGRLFYIVDEATAANMSVPGQWSLVARDPFNSTLLWKKRLPLWVSESIRFRSGPPQVTRLLIATAQHLYIPRQANAPISKLDAATGKTITTYGSTAGAEEMVLTDDTLLVLTGSPVAEQTAKLPQFMAAHRTGNRKSIVAIDLQKGEKRWKWNVKVGDVRPETLASDGKQVYVQISNGVICLDLNTGKQRWSHGTTTERTRRKLTFGKYTLVVNDGVVLCNLSGTLAALSSANGHVLWQRQVALHGFHAPLDIFVIDGLVWCGSARNDSKSPAAVGDFAQGVDLHTGKPKVTEDVLAELRTAGHHHRCYREKATSRYILAGKRGIELLDLAGTNQSRNNWIRGTCQYGIMPANGLLYCPPTSCGCYMESLLHGFWTLASTQSAIDDPERLVASKKRLLHGPAYTANADSKMTRGEAAVDWPTYRQNALRSGVSLTVVPRKLAQKWTTRLGGRLTQPVIQHDRIVVASIDQHTVYALDTGSGKEEWQFTCGGRVDSAPTIYKDRLLFGSADGQVYCVRLSDGKLIWRFQCAPMSLTTVAHDQLASLWPVHGSILILNGTAYCAAGRSTWIDGGMYLYALDPITGTLLHEYNYHSQAPTFEQNRGKATPEQVRTYAQNQTDYKTFLQPDLSDSFSMAGGTRSDVLVSDGKNLFLHQAAFDTKLNRQTKMSRHLFSTSSLLDDHENHRSHWMLGTGDFSRVPVAYSWIVNSPKARRRGCATAVPYGVMLVFDDRAVWGIHRQGRANGRYTVFQRENRPFSETEPSLPDFRSLPSGADPYPYVWSVEIDRRPRALVKAGDLLFLGTTPTNIQPKAPNAAYEGPSGGAILVLRAEDGARVAEYRLEHPVVWDGMAAANRRLYVSTTDGNLICY